MDGPAYESTHQLLLGLAGHLDDDLLGWVRELVAVGEEARAVSLVTAGVVAERIQLPGPVRAALVDAGRAARSGIDPVELAPAAEPTVEHRFATAPAGATDVASAVRALPARQLQGTTVHLAWRLTPAGTAPGPLPHPVVLVEIDPGRHSGEMLAYLVASGLARGGVHASVEVVAAGQAHTGYHDAALAAAAVPVGGALDPGLATAPFVVRHAEPTVVEADEESIEVDEPVAEAVRPATVEAAAVTEPVRIIEATPAAAAESESENGTEVVAEDEEPEDEPESVLDPNERHPFADDPVEPAPAAVPSAGRRRPTADVPALSALSDPLSGPLSEPLMAPLLDPTIHAHDPLGVDHLVGPSRHPFAPAEPSAPAPRPTPVPDPTPQAAEAAVSEPVQEPAVEPAIEDSWAAEWASGAWAMPMDDPDPAQAAAEIDPGTAPEIEPETTDDAAAEFDADPEDALPVPPPHPARHGFAPQDGPAPRASEPPRPRPAPVQRPVVRGPRRIEEPRPEPRRAPQPPPVGPDTTRPDQERTEPARLSDADRELLARLQAELVEGRKPRAPRRPGAPTGGRASNGRGPGRTDDPPDNAS